MNLTLVSLQPCKGVEHRVHRSVLGDLPPAHARLADGAALLVLHRLLEASPGGKCIIATESPLVRVCFVQEDGSNEHGILPPQLQEQVSSHLQK